MRPSTFDSFWFPLSAAATAVAAAAFGRTKTPRRAPPTVITVGAVASTAAPSPVSAYGGAGKTHHAPTKAKPVGRVASTSAPPPPASTSGSSGGAATGQHEPPTAKKADPVDPPASPPPPSADGGASGTTPPPSTNDTSGGAVTGQDTPPTGKKVDPVDPKAGTPPPSANGTSSTPPPASTTNNTTGGAATGQPPPPDAKKDDPPASEPPKSAPDSSPKQTDSKNSAPPTTSSATANKPTPVLGTYGRDLTAAAGTADPVVGRHDEIERVVCILCRRTKNCAVLVGAPGVGKTAIAEGLAQRIAAGKVPAALAGARVVEVDLGLMVAGTTYRGMFEERLKDVIREAEEVDGKVVLFIDEMHMLVGAGRGGGTMDGANMLKPALARGRIRCLGATTFEEYRKYIEKDAALERRFRKVHVDEPSTKATIEILKGLKQRYEEHHDLKIHDDALAAAVQLAARYITGRQFPDKAIDLIDEACATTRVQFNHQREANTTDIQDEDQKQVNAHGSSANAGEEAIVRPDHVAQVVSLWTGIPVTTLDLEEKEKLMHLADRLHERVVGQDEAVNSVAQAVLRSRAGLDQSGKPIGSFLFLGSTGVGKTELAKALAEQLFDDENVLIRFDMSEYVSPGSVQRFIGAPPGLDGGQLTEKVKRRPYSVVLFDEVEKADPQVFDVFLQILDDGMLTDGKGQTVDFKNTIIIMTSNLGAEHVIAGITGEKTTEEAHELVMQKVREHLKPELLNRLSEIVVFEPLLQDKLKQVVDIQIKRIVASVARKGISLSVSDAAMDVILAESYNPMYGARPIRRWVEKNVMTKLSELLIGGEVREGSTISIDGMDGKALKYEVVKGGKRVVVVEVASNLDDRDGDQSPDNEDGK